METSRRSSTGDEWVLEWLYALQRREFNLKLVQSGWSACLIIDVVFLNNVISTCVPIYLIDLAIVDLLIALKAANYCLLAGDELNEASGTKWFTFSAKIFVCIVPASNALMEIGTWSICRQTRVWFGINAYQLSRIFALNAINELLLWQ